MENNLNSIFIRAQDKNGKWGSFSLKELVDMGLHYQVVRWGVMQLEKIKEGQNITVENIDRMITMLKFCGIPLVELKEEVKRSERETKEQLSYFKSPTDYKVAMKAMSTYLTQDNLKRGIEALAELERGKTKKTKT